MHDAFAERIARTQNQTFVIRVTISSEVAVNIDDRRLTESVCLAVQWMIQNMSDVKKVHPHRVRARCGDKVFEAVDRGKFSDAVCLIELSDRQPLSVKIAEGEADDIIEVAKDPRQ